MQAVDAATGDLLWSYEKSFPATPGSGFRSTMRSIAIYGDKLFVATADAHIVALDARTGSVVWDHAVADSGLGYRYSSGPLIVKGKVVAGLTGCERYKHGVCFISAHDPETDDRLDVEVAKGLQRGREFNRLAEARDDEAITVTAEKGA